MLLHEGTHAPFALDPALDSGTASAPTRYAGAPGANAVRELEEGFSRTEGLPAVPTAAWSRSRAASHPQLPLTATDVTAYGSHGGEEVQYRSDSIKRVYEAQHHFVLAALTAPGVEAFLADDFSDEDADPTGELLSRSSSKFV